MRRLRLLLRHPSRALRMPGLLFLLGLAACAKQPDRECCPCQEGKPLDQQLMLLLSTARALHHQADLHLQQGEVDQAIEAVRGILALQLEPRWPEADETRLDAAARLGKLLLGKGKPQEALALVEGELGGTHRESFYLSNLHSVRGEILQARSKQLDQEGNKAEAQAAAREAIAAFERSIEMNKQLQKQLLSGGN